jgi:hypothetical protein
MKLENFSFCVENETLIGHCIVMENSFYLWVGSSSQPCNFGVLETAMLTRYDNMPLSTTIFHESEGYEGNSALARRISKKFGMQVFASVNVDLGEANAQMEIGIFNALSVILKV